MILIVIGVVIFLKSAFGTNHGISSKQFWTGPPKHKGLAWRYNPKIGKQEEVEMQLRPDKNNMYEWYYSLLVKEFLKGVVLIFTKLLVNYQDLKQVILQGKYKCMGPYDPLHEQLEYDKNTGEVTHQTLGSF